MTKLGRSKSVSLLLCLLFCALYVQLGGCATTRKEKYHIWSDHVYHRVFSANAETLFKATRDALETLGWKIAEQEIVQDITHPLTEEARQYYGWIYTSGRITSY